MEKRLQYIGLEGGHFSNATGMNLDLYQKHKI